jgi:hypothetical protein
MPSCNVCGTTLDERARFCPECGARVETSPHETAVVPVPPPESEPGPVSFGEQPRWFGVTPSGSVFALAVGAFALALLFFATGRWIVGLVLLVLAGALFAYFASLVRRRPDSAVARVSAEAVGSLRARMGAAVDAVGAVSSGRRALLRLRHEQEDLRSRRERLVRSLGEAVYLADDQATESARAELTEVDEALAAKEAEMTKIATEMQQRLRASRDEVRQTQLLEPPGPPDVPEPSPPPDEGTPPTPAPVPEPYPPPDEVTIPQPDPVPAPEPDPEPEGPGSRA